jgi:hypothetical protein
VKIRTDPSGLTVAVLLNVRSKACSKVRLPSSRSSREISTFGSLSGFSTSLGGFGLSLRGLEPMRLFCKFSTTPMRISKYPRYMTLEAIVTRYTSTKARVRMLELDSRPTPKNRNSHPRTESRLPIQMKVMREHLSVGFNQTIARESGGGERLRRTTRLDRIGWPPYVAGREILSTLASIFFDFSRQVEHGVEAVGREPPRSIGGPWHQARPVAQISTKVCHRCCSIR